MGSAAGKSRMILTLLALLSPSLCLFAKGKLVIESIERQLDLRGQAEKIRSVMVVRNAGQKPEPSMLIAVPEERELHLSYVKATVGKKKHHVLPIKKRGPNGEALHKLEFSKPLQPGKDKKVTVIYGYVGILTPNPSEIKQNDPHLVKYHGSIYETTPYMVETQKTSIKMSTSNVISSTKFKPKSHKGDKITYGPFTNIQAYASKPLSLHFETTAQFSTVTELEREIKVCHWGGVVFSETYNLRHSGAKLKDVFSRVDYERMQRGSSFEYMSAKLPANSYGIDYRDDIGNISTSNVRKSRKYVLFEMRPRFPLFGGWHVVFNLYYTVPIYQLVGAVTGSSTFMLNTTFSSPFEDIVVDEATLKIVLPEGSSGIKWVTPFHIDSVDFEIQKTYLDLTGRPVLVLHAKNLMRYHNQHFQVLYSYPSIMLHRGPMFVVIGFMAFFGLVILMTRVDFTIGQEELVSAKQSKRKTE